MFAQVQYKDLNTLWIPVDNCFIAKLCGEAYRRFLSRTWIKLYGFISDFRRLKIDAESISSFMMKNFSLLLRSAIRINTAFYFHCQVSRGLRKEQSFPENIWLLLGHTMSLHFHTYFSSFFSWLFKIKRYSICPLRPFWGDLSILIGPLPQGKPWIETVLPNKFGFDW